jgi:D-alanine-D-alanine ligase
MRVGLTYDLKEEHPLSDDVPPDFAAEFDTEQSIAELEAAITRCGHQVNRIGNVYDLIRFVVDGKSADIVFNMAEGLWGRARESQVPAILEAYRIPYTGSDPLTMAICLDKGMTKRVWRGDGLPTPDFVVVSDVPDVDRGEDLPEFPLFVKPVHEGSSKGIAVESIVDTREQLRDRVAWALRWYRQPVLIEEFLSGREFTAGILGNGTAARVLEVGEVLLVASDRVHGAEQKEQWRARVPEKLGRVEPDLKGTLSDLALRAYHAVGCRDVGRIDLRLDKRGEPQLLEINPVAGLYPDRSSLPIVARMAGLSFDDLVGEIIAQAARRCGLC